MVVCHQPHDQLKAISDNIAKTQGDTPINTSIGKDDDNDNDHCCCAKMYHLFIKIAFGKDFCYVNTKKEEMSAEQPMTMRDGGYVVLPRKENQRLYNSQYAELTTLKKKVDLEEKHETFLEAMLKKHYLHIYQDMLKNDYIMTGSNHIESELNNKATTESECQRLNL